MTNQAVVSQGFRVTATPLLTQATPTARRLLVLHFPVTSTPRPAQVVVEVGDRRLAQDLGPIPAGETMAQVLVPEVTGPTQGTVSLTIGDDSWTSPLILAPARPWTVYVVPHSHTDIGFTHPASEVVAIHDENTDEAIAFCNLTRDWPDGCRFKWTCEVSWQVQNYLHNRPAAQIARLRDCLQSGQMEVAAVYAGLHTDLCGLEELVRSLAFAGGLRRRWDINVDTAMICDVPGATWSYPQVLARSGIRYLILADNNFSAPFLAFTDLPRPFYWQGPDGSRVLAWYTDDPFWSYIEGFKFGFGESYRHVQRALPLKLAELEEQGYPYNAFQLQLASDNCRVPFRPALIAKQWLEQWANPRLRLATAREFLAHMEATYGDSLPVRRGDWTNWWSATATSFPHETSLGRRLKEDLASAERLGTWAQAEGAVPYPGEQAAEAYDRLLAFDEHSGGGGLWRPRSPEEQARALHEGYAFPHQAASAAAGALGAALDSLAGQITNEDDLQEGIAVFNPLSWPRTDLANIALPGGATAAAVVDPESGQVLPLQRTAPGRARFLAHQAPPLGYKVYRPVTEKVEAGCELRADARHLENRFYRLELDEQGHIRSIVDRVAGRELVDGAADHCFGQLLWYRPTPHREFPPGGEFPDQVELYEGLPVPGEVLAPLAGEVQVQFEDAGPVSARLLVEREVAGPFRLRQEIALHAGLRRIDMTYTLSPQGEPASEKAQLGYFHFAFRLSDPRFRLELPGAVLSPEEQQLRGACRDHWAAQHWLAVYNPQYTVLLSAMDAPLVELGQRAPSHQRFLRHWKAELATVWVRALTLSPGRGVTDSPYCQGAPLTFRFSLAGHSGPLDPVVAMHHGWATLNPLLSRSLPPRQAGSLPAAQSSWCQLAPDSVMLVTAKAARDGDGLILRLWEAGGQACDASLSLPQLGRLSAWRCTPLEDDIAPLDVVGHTVRVPLSEYAIETVRVRSGSGDGQALAAGTAAAR